MRGFLLSIVTVVSLAMPAAAEDFDSRYTSTAPKNCRIFDRVKVADTDYAASRVCKGVAGSVVVIAENDLRETVSVGSSIKAAAKELAAGESFGPFNSALATVEWRSVKGAPKPFAIIQRWTIADNEHPDAKSGRPTSPPLLIVTRLAPACHVAYIDVKANADPNSLARKAADEIARGFQCGKDKVRIVGEHGRAAVLAEATRTSQDLN